MSLPKETVPDPLADPLVAAAMRAATSGEAGGCPDAEVLGLYAERSLEHTERAQVEGHVHACPRCQATVAALVRAMPADADEAGAVSSTTRASAGGFAAWFAGWRWLVPTASLAAVALVAVWVGRPTGAGDGATTTTTDAPAASAPLPAPGSPPDAAPTPELRRDAPRPAERAAQSRQAFGTGERREAVAEEAAKALADASRENQAARPSPEMPAPMAGLAAGAGAAAERDAAAPAAKAAPGRESAEGARSRIAETTAAAPAPPPPAAARVPPPAAAPATADTAAFRAAAPPPGWRVTDGVVERSRDQGRSWQRVATPPGVRVVAVASPGANVCWAVAASAVLRTADGSTWVRTSVPTTEPLMGVMATSATGAVVFTAAGDGFSTTDGGVTWAPAR